jgi:two-component system chemotaxis sensor kinase CheA
VKVLIIDDSELARVQLRRLLRGAGFQVFEQPSAIGATRNISQNGIDVALVDVSMPGLSGDKLVGVLRGNPRLKGLRIVLVSAKDEKELQTLAVETGADAVLSKAQVETDLVDLLARLDLGPPAAPHDSRRGKCAK